MDRIESLLSARLFLAPHLAGGRIYFVSNLSGRLSLYAMDEAGSVPEPLLPPQIALQNPELAGGRLFYVFPQLDTILLMLDHDGDENYQPVRIPLAGGYPEPAFGEALAGQRVAMGEVDPERGVVYLTGQSRTAQLVTTYRASLVTGELTELAASPWGFGVIGARDDHSRLVLAQGYTFGDTVLFELGPGEREPRPLYGTPLEQRAEGEPHPPSGIRAGALTPSGRGLLLVSAAHEDTYGLGYLDLDAPAGIMPVAVSGLRHSGVGELEDVAHLDGERFRLTYNIDGAAWVYEARLDEAARALRVERVLVGEGPLAGGVLEGLHYDPATGRTAIAFTTATQPTQIFVAGPEGARQVTRERVLGIPQGRLAPGEDASFSSHDGLRVSARLYLPSPELGFAGPQPLVYYIHGGPQSQERPNFAWFSMPLIQLLTLRGFAVFVPNARGSSGYGLSYMKRVDRDWGGQDRLDHVHAMTKVLPGDPRVDVNRAGVVGRSYGGYMTLTLAARHPELWAAAVDMFGPYDLMTFIERLPETWKPYFAIAVGDPAIEEGRALLAERSPRSYMEHLAAPLLVIQGANDPRVTERESRDVAEQLTAMGKRAELLVFGDEGHDVLKHENRVRCYNAIADFFAAHLRP